jgi:predicted Rossmann fold flavoprotein
MPNIQKFDVVILGAGAAGLMCAMRAGQRGKKVLVLDHGTRAGAKILISGGGRCNFTNRHIAADRYISNNPHFCLSALKTFTQHDFIALIEKHQIPYHEKKLGQLFCNGSASAVVDMLLSECKAAGVELRLGQHIERLSKPCDFHIHTREEAFETPAVVLATGGLSIPKMGSTNFAHETAKQFGLSLTEMRPGLVPLTFEGEAFTPFRALSGVSLEVVISCGKRAFRENMIFTHKGLSGPAVLQISSYWKEGLPLSIDLLPDLNAETFLLERKAARPKAGLKTILGEVLPGRLAHSLTDAYFTASPAAEISNDEIKSIANALKAWKLFPTGTEGYEKAEITLGGISTKELSSKTMESTTVKGLYVIGEALDVSGLLGGYNLQWAWSSGWAAGSAV